ncbi:MAG TPA: dephospho-CoA kinase [bacterium]|nr:dephospho-CoA kinase [bacterium]
MTSHKRPWKIGLTGGPGAGKSLALRFLARKGVPTLQTDHLGHELLRDKGFSGRLSRRLGKEILDVRGHADRGKLGELVFKDPRKRVLLNRMIHPMIRRKVAQWVLAQRRAKAGLVVVEVPLLFERGFYKYFDGCLSVSAPSALRRKRLRARGWDRSEVRRREGTQWSQSRKDRKADWVLRNDRSPAELRKKVDLWLSSIKDGPQGMKKKVF